MLSRIQLRLLVRGNSTFLSQETYTTIVSPLRELNRNCRSVCAMRLSALETGDEIGSEIGNEIGNKIGRARVGITQ